MELAGWTRTSAPGGGVVMTAPEPDIASLRIRPNLRPVWPLRTILDARIQNAGPVEITSAIARFLTDDGEHGAWIEMRRGRGDEALEWVIATVVTEDEQLVVEGVGRGSRVAEWVLGVARELPSTVPTERVRMYAYRPPDHWLGVRRAFGTCWIPRTRSPAHIVVCDAVPLSMSVATLELLWPSGATRVTTFERTCERFRYRVLLHDGSDVDRALVEELVSTIEPCPRPRRDTSSIMEAFAWMT